MGSEQSSCRCSGEQPQVETKIASLEDLIGARKRESLKSNPGESLALSPHTSKDVKLYNLSTEVSKSRQFLLVSPRKSDSTIGGLIQGFSLEEELSPAGRRRSAKIFISEQDYYEGEVEGGRLTGSGRLTISSKGMTYEGEFLDNQRHGQGTETWSDGRRYSGDFKNDKKEGYGEWSLPDGTSYTGQFLNGNFDGFGVLSKPNEYRYTGTFLNGVKHGTGKISYANGDFYDGSFFKGKRHGKGIFFFSQTQTTYDGDWFNGKQHGVGFINEPGFGKVKALYQDGVQVATLE